MEEAYYHRRAVFHVDDAGHERGLPVNLAAWALGCAWRGLERPYVLRGPIVVTGPYSDDGEVTALSPGFADQVRAVSATVRETGDGWQHRPSVDSPAGLAELLACVRRDLAAAG